MLTRHKIVARVPFSTARRLSEVLNRGTHACTRARALRQATILVCLLLPRALEILSRTPNEGHSPTPHWEALKSCLTFFSFSPFLLRTGRHTRTVRDFPDDEDMHKAWNMCELLEIPFGATRGTTRSKPIVWICFLLRDGKILVRLLGLEGFFSGNFALARLQKCANVNFQLQWMRTNSQRWEKRRYFHMRTSHASSKPAPRSKSRTGFTAVWYACQVRSAESLKNLDTSKVLPNVLEEIKARVPSLAL